MNEPHIFQAESSEPGLTTPDKFPETYAEAKELSDKTLQALSPKDRIKVSSQLKMLDNVCRYIGKDFDMPVILTAPKFPWHWNSVENYVAVDPTDLLESDIDENLWSVGHEATHRRITRNTPNTDEMLHQPGGALLRNVIEDPRVNNFLSDNYGLLDRGMHHYYDAQVAGHEAKAASFAAQNGFVPRHDLASFEYIKLWYRDRQHETVEPSVGLPEDVRDVIGNTIKAAREAWWTYPTRKEADKSEAIIDNYATASGGIIASKIWPEFQKLIEEDQQDAMSAKKLLEMIQEIIDGADPEGFDELPVDLQEMLKAIANIAKELNKPPKPVNLSELTDGQKQALREFLQNLSDEEKERLSAEAKEMLDEFDSELASDLGSEFDVDMPMPDMPVREQSNEPKSGGEVGDTQEEQNSDLASYNESYRDVQQQITELYNNLNNLFIARKSNGYTGGYRHGSRLSVAKRMQEKAQGISAAQSHAWEKRELPLEKDYVVSILVDLSGSMTTGGDFDYSNRFTPVGSRIESAMKSAIVVAEALAKMNIRFEINGFNGLDFSFKKFQDKFGNDIRQNIPSMVDESRGSGSNYNDDGWALQQASERLRSQKASEKLLVVLSDGEPRPSYEHDGNEYELGQIVRDILAVGDVKLASIGIQSSSVEYYYPDYAVVNDIAELPGELARVVQRLIEQA